MLESQFQEETLEATERPPMQNLKDIQVYSFGVDLRIFSRTRLHRIFWFMKFYTYCLYVMALEMNLLRVRGMILNLTWFMTFTSVLWSVVPPVVFPWPKLGQLYYTVVHGPAIDFPNM
jgi:hypothetical protein